MLIQFKKNKEKKLSYIITEAIYGRTSSHNCQCNCTIATKSSRKKGISNLTKLFISQGESFTTYYLLFRQNRFTNGGNLKAPAVTTGIEKDSLVFEFEKKGGIRKLLAATVTPFNRHGSKNQSHRCTNVGIKESRKIAGSLSSKELLGSLSTAC